MLSATNYDPERTKAAVRKMIENKVRGVAVMTSQHGAEIAEELVSNHMPVVFLDLGQVRNYISNIRIDHEHGTRQAIRYLYDLGHRIFAFVAGPHDRLSAARYRDAFLKAVQDLGIGLHKIVEGNNKVDGGSAAVQELLRQSALPTAILCSNDLAALGAIIALKEAGVRVPADISVIGSDDIYFARLASPPLTTLRLSREQLGILAFEALEKMLHSKRLKGTEYVLTTQLVIRQSVGPAHPDELRLREQFERNPR